MTSLERRILTCLQREHSGVDRAIKRSDLAHLICVNDRQMRDAISILRRVHHEPICTTTDGGYFYPATRQEAEYTLYTTLSRIRELGESVNGVKKGLDRQFGDSLF